MNLAKPEVQQQEEVQQIPESPTYLEIVETIDKAIGSGVYKLRTNSRVRLRRNDLGESAKISLGNAMHVICKVIGNTIHVRTGSNLFDILIGDEKVMEMFGKVFAANKLRGISKAHIENKYAARGKSHLLK